MDDALLMLLWLAALCAVLAPAAWIADQCARFGAVRRYHHRSAARYHYRRPDGAPEDY